MTEVGDEAIDLEWLRELVSRPDWYRAFHRSGRARLIGKLAVRRTLRGRSPSALRSSDLLYEAFEQLLNEGSVHLGDAGPDWDAERQPTDTLVIHHTSRRPGVTRCILNAMHLLRLYVPVYNHPSETDRPRVEGQPIFSGHFRANQEVFWGYHWLVRADGQADRLLRDDEIGWQAGDWRVNCRSVGICLDDDLSDKAPARVVLDGLVKLIEDNYSSVNVSPQSVLGHREVNKNTECPGDRFVSEWKESLLQLLGG